MVHRKRRGERDPVRAPLTLDQMLLGGSFMVTSAATHTQVLRLNLVDGTASTSDLQSALKAFQMARDALEEIIPLTRRKYREAKSAEIQAKR